MAREICSCTNRKTLYNLKLSIVNMTPQATVGREASQLQLFQPAKTAKSDWVGQATVFRPRHDAAGAPLDAVKALGSFESCAASSPAGCRKPELALKKLKKLLKSS